MARAYDATIVDVEWVTAQNVACIRIGQRTVNFVQICQQTDVGDLIWPSLRKSYAKVI